MGDNGLDGCGEGEAIEALFGFVFVDRLGHYGVVRFGGNDADGGVGIAEKGVFTEEIPERLEGGAGDVDLRFFTEKGSLVRRDPTGKRKSARPKPDRRSISF